jgi:hypothetical protein
VSTIGFIVKKADRGSDPVMECEPCFDHSQAGINQHYDSPTPTKSQDWIVRQFSHVFASLAVLTWF